MGPVHDRGNAYQCIAENKTRQNLKKNLNGLLHSLQETRKSFLARSADTARYSPDQIEETDSEEGLRLILGQQKQKKKNNSVFSGLSFVAPAFMRRPSKYGHQLWSLFSVSDKFFFLKEYSSVLVGGS